MTAWSFTIIGIVIIVCITCWVMNRNHRKNLEEHAKRMDEIYRNHG